MPAMSMCDADTRTRPHGAIDHRVQFYDTEDFLEDVVSAYLREGLANGDGLVVAVTPRHWEMFRARLQREGAAVGDALAAGRMVVLDAERAAVELVVSGAVQTPRFLSLIGGALRSAAARAESGRVRAFGEVVNVMWTRGQVAIALDLEEHWNSVLTPRDALLCAYRMMTSAHGACAETLAHVCATHTAVAPEESYLRLPSDEERNRAVAVLTQRARDLQREIERRKAAEQRERELAEATRQREQFIAVLGHELRNPLAAITAAVHLMRAAPPDVVERARAVIERQTATMTRLVEDLLDITRINEGKIVLRRERVDLAVVVDRALEVLRPAFAVRRQRLAVSLPAAPIWASGDPVRIEQILSNLLHNASKYTPAGGEITLSACLDEGAISITVRDDGRGMSADVLATIFEPFVQAEPCATSPESGLGLGLALVRRLTELHGGTIAAHSDGPGRGSTFVVHLPPAEPAPGDLGGPAA